MLLKIARFLAELQMLKKRVEAEILSKFQMLEKLHAKMELRYKIICKSL
jgi:hypothetical protein